MMKWAAFIGSSKETLVNPNKNLDRAEFCASEPVRSIGNIANDLLVRGCTGKILAIVSNATYLRTNNGEIFWLARDTVQMHPRGVNCACNGNALHIGINFIARDAILTIGEDITMDVHEAYVWQPRTIKPAFAAPREVVNARVRPLETLYTTSLTINHITQMRHAKNIAAIAEQSKALIGLGAGLTPAGDDFVGGLLFAAHHLRKAYALTWNPSPIEDLLDWARTQTNVISYTILRDLAQGQGPEPLHDLLCALLARDATEDAAECAARLAQIGSSTGTEILAGMLTGMRLIEDKVNSE